MVLFCFLFFFELFSNELSYIVHILSFYFYFQRSPSWKSLR